MDGRTRGVVFVVLGVVTILLRSDVVVHPSRSSWSAWGGLASGFIYLAAGLVMPRLDRTRAER